MLCQGSVAVCRYTVNLRYFVIHSMLKNVQNYLVYTNTVLFMRSGGDSRLAGALLAVATFGVLVIGPVIIGFIPIMVVGALIFYLGFDLLREALIDTIGRVSKLEYLTVSFFSLKAGTFLRLVDCYHCPDYGNL